VYRKKFVAGRKLPATTMKRGVTMSKRACLLTKDDVPVYIRAIVKRMRPTLMEYKDDTGDW